MLHPLRMHTALVLCLIMICTLHYWFILCRSLFYLEAMAEMREIFIEEMHGHRSVRIGQPSSLHGVHQPISEDGVRLLQWVFIAFYLLEHQHMRKIGGWVERVRQHPQPGNRFGSVARTSRNFLSNILSE